MFLRLLLGTPLIQILLVIITLIVIAVSLWKLVTWLRQFPTWLIAMNVFSALMAALWFVTAVWLW